MLNMETDHKGSKLLPLVSTAFNAGEGVLPGFYEKYGFKKENKRI